MAIIPSGGTIRNDLYSISTTAQILNNINTTLVAAGWTSVPVAARNTIIFSGQPSNNQNVTLGLVTYTFLTVMPNLLPGQVLIGATAQDTYQNLYYAMQLGLGSGTLYSSSTPLNADLTPFLTTGSFLILYNTPGPVGNTFYVFTGTLANAVFYNGCNSPNGFPLIGGGYNWTSTGNNVGMKVQVYGYSSPEGGNQCRFIVQNETGQSTTGVLTVGCSDSGNNIYGMILRVASVPNMRVIANNKQFFAFENDSSTGFGSFIGFGVPYLLDFLAPVPLTGASNANPIQIQTPTPHGLVSGDNVCISGVLTNTAANGQFNVTVISATVFTIPIAGNGIYTSGGLVGKIGSTISEAFFGINRGNEPSFIRNSLSSGYEAAWVLNGSVTLASVNNTNVGGLRFVVPQLAASALNGRRLPFYDNTSLFSEPIIGWGTSPTGTFFVFGQLYDSFVENRQEPIGTQGVLNGLNYYALTVDNAGDANNVQGTFCVRIP